MVREVGFASGNINMGNINDQSLELTTHALSDYGFSSPKRNALDLLKIIVSES